MKQTLRKTFAFTAIALMMLIALISLVACNKGDAEDKTANEYIDRCLTEDFIDPWLGFTLDKAEEYGDVSFEMCVVDLSLGVNILSFLPFRAVVWGDGCDIMAGTFFDGFIFFVFHFIDESHASAFAEHAAEEEFGVNCYTTVKGNIVYLESIEGYIDNYIMKRQLNKDLISSQKLEFLYSSLNEVKDKSTALIFEFSPNSLKIESKHSDGNITSYHSFCPVSSDYRSAKDQEILSTGLWYTADSYIDTTREEGYVYEKLVDKPGFKYEFIKDKNGDPTNAINVCGYSYESSGNVNLIIPSYIDEHPVEEVSNGSNTAIRADALFSFNLKSIKFPKTMKKFDPAYGSHAIEKIEVEEGNPYYHADGNCLIETATSKLIFACKNSVIPDYVKEIGERAFYGCHIESVDIPAGVEKIYNAFDRSLMYINYSGTAEQFKELIHFNVYNDSSITVNCINGTLKIDPDGISEV